MHMAGTNHSSANNDDHRISTSGQASAPVIMSHLTLSFGSTGQFHVNADPIAQRLEQSFALHKGKILRVPAIQQDLIRAPVLVPETPDVLSAKSYAATFADLRSTSVLEAVELSNEKCSQLDQAFTAHRTRLGDVLQPVLLSPRHSLRQQNVEEIGDNPTSAPCQPSHHRTMPCLLEVPCLVSYPQVCSSSTLRNDIKLDLGVQQRMHAGALSHLLCESWYCSCTAHHERRSLLRLLSCLRICMLSIPSIALLPT